jgi:hypothetical protein
MNKFNHMISEKGKEQGMKADERVSNMLSCQHIKLWQFQTPPLTDCKIVPRDTFPDRRVLKAYGMDSTA